jgi:NAD(P)-dependent dehydrogenase (short-subunit alcohol dehydrogenase family)
VAIVTGATGSLGRVVTKILLENGAKVVSPYSARLFEFRRHRTSRQESEQFSYKCKLYLSFRIFDVKRFICTDHL